MTVKTAKPTHALRRQLDALEDRSLMAANVTAVYGNGVLYIEGTESADKIIVREQGGVITVDNTPVYSNGKAYSGVYASAVNRVEVNALGGNDVISLSERGQEVTRSAVVDAGAGNDIVLGGANRDFLYG